METETLQQNQLDPQSPEMDLKSFRQQEERQWIVWYQMALERERERLTMEQDALGKEVKSLSGKAEAISQDVRELNILQTQISEKGEAMGVILDRISSLDTCFQQPHDNQGESAGFGEPWPCDRSLVPQVVGAGNIVGVSGRFRIGDFDRSR